MIEELKPCPFCGEPPYIEDNSFYNLWTLKWEPRFEIHHYCHQPGTEIQFEIHSAGGSFNSLEDAATFWNRRVNNNND